MKHFLIAFTLLMCSVAYAQYTPGAINYGLVAVKHFDELSTAGVGARVEYAYNCYNTFMIEYNRSVSFGSDNDNQGYNEFALGTNLILFNWDPTAITAGMGIVTNDDPLFEEKEGDASLFFTTGNLNHGIQIKLRALHHLNRAIHIFGELNIRTLGADYHNFLIGFNYNFNPRR